MPVIAAAPLTGNSPPDEPLPPLSSRSARNAQLALQSKVLVLVWWIFADVGSSAR